VGLAKPLRPGGVNVPPERAVKITAPVDGIILVLGTKVTKDEDVPRDRLITIDGVRYYRLAIGDKVEQDQVLVHVHDPRPKERYQASARQSGGGGGHGLCLCEDTC